MSYSQPTSPPSSDLIPETPPLPRSASNWDYDFDALTLRSSWTPAQHAAVAPRAQRRDYFAPQPPIPLLADEEWEVPGAQLPYMREVQFRTKANRRCVENSYFTARRSSRRARPVRAGLNGGRGKKVDQRIEQEETKRSGIQFLSS